MDFCDISKTSFKFSGDCEVRWVGLGLGLGPRVVEQKMLQEGDFDEEVNLLNLPLLLLHIPKNQINDVGEEIYCPEYVCVLFYAAQ